MSVTGEPDGRPLKVGAAVVDLVCGLLAANGIQAALVERARTGRGRHVEVSLMDAALTPCSTRARRGWPAASCRGPARQPPPEHRPVRDLRGGRPAVRRSRSATTGCSCACARRSASASSPRRALRDQRGARRARRRARGRAQGASCAREPADHGWSGCARRACPAGPINGVDEAFALRGGARHGAGRGGRRRPARPRRRCASTASARRSAGARRALDEHGDEIRAWLKDEQRRTREGERKARSHRRLSEASPPGRRGVASLATRGTPTGAGTPTSPPSAVAVKRLEPPSKAALGPLSAAPPQNLSQLHRAGALPLI